MFDLGIQELIVIFVVALLVFGPKRLPELGRTLGKAMGELRRAVQGVKEQVDSEVREIKYPLSVDPTVNPTAEEVGKKDAYATAGDAAQVAESSTEAAPSPEDAADKAPEHKDPGGHGGKG